MLPVRHSDGVGSISIATYYLLGYFNIMERKPHKKLLCMVVTLCQSVYCLMSGMYGTPSELGIFTSLIIILQLCGAGLMVMMLNELLEKYGMGSSDIFIVTNICGTVFWKAFSPVTINTDGGREFEGVIIAFLHMLASHSDKFQALYKVLFRHNLPNLLNLTATVLVFATVIYLQVAKQLMDKQNMVLRGHQNLHKSLNQYIPTAATLGGLCIGALCVFADIFGKNSDKPSKCLSCN
ncbi:Protein transport protein Sec61 subunit alpha isoform A [Geodia barretti]|uniref:Protein transport protein Sec61 subunit alpha isoform A n=1 Tax=Geodia barretti TaxID=519541 RepID=A0AA35RS43_GEOBA|nr:Protein transport protein Sec61 subunit alpha isoform A [Geodia barretti]